MQTAVVVRVGGGVSTPTPTLVTGTLKLGWACLPVDNSKFHGGWVSRPPGQRAGGSSPPTATAGTTVGPQIPRWLGFPATGPTIRRRGRASDVNVARALCPEFGVQTAVIRLRGTAEIRTPRRSWRHLAARWRSP